MIKNHFEGRPRREIVPLGYELPKAAVSLLETATEHGWLTGWRWGEDNGGSPFVSVYLALTENGVYLKYTWHNRDCAPGRMRLFSSLIRPAGRVLWEEGLTLKKARQAIEEGPASIWFMPR